MRLSYKIILQSPHLFWKNPKFKAQVTKNNRQLQILTNTKPAGSVFILGKWQYYRPNH